MGGGGRYHTVVRDQRSVRPTLLTPSIVRRRALFFRIKQRKSACYPKSEKSDLGPTNEDLSVGTPELGTHLFMCGIRML